MHPSSSSFSDFQEVPFLTTYKVTLPRMTNINKTNTMVQKEGLGWGGGGEWWVWNNLMKPALRKKKCNPWSHFFVFFFVFKEGAGDRNDSADSTVTVTSSHRKSGVNRRETSHNEYHRPTKKSAEGSQSSTLSFPPLFLLNAVFWVVVVVFFGHYSHQQAWSTVTQNVLCLSRCHDRPKKEKRHCIFTSRSFGATFFWQSSVFVQECLTAQFFSWHDKWFIDTILSLKTCVCINVSHNTDRTEGLHLEATILLVSVW